MLRFGTKSASAARRRRAGPSRGRVWMLLAMLAAVTMLMRQLNRPETGEKLGRALAIAPTEKAGAIPDDWDATTPPGDPAAWASVKDNALFLPAEQQAWFMLLDHARMVGQEGDAAPKGPEVAYAQLASQPEVYRGRPVRVRGTVVRESLELAAKNDYGISTYHQLVLAPRGGGDLPILAYVLELPEDFPRGEQLREAAAVDGYFFKTKSFSDGEQLGLAPVIVAASIHWQPARAPAERPATINVNRMWLGVVGAAVAAALVAVWVARQTRRPRGAIADAMSDATRHSLAALVDGESEP